MPASPHTPRRRIAFSTTTTRRGCVHQSGSVRDGGDRESRGVRRAGWRRLGLYEDQSHGHGYPVWVRVPRCMWREQHAAPSDLQRGELLVRGRYLVQLQRCGLRQRGQLLALLRGEQHLRRKLRQVVQRRLSGGGDLHADRRRQRQHHLRCGIDLQHHLHRSVLGELRRRHALRADLSRSERQDADRLRQLRLAPRFRMHRRRVHTRPDDVVVAEYEQRPRARGALHRAHRCRSRGEGARRDRRRHRRRAARSASAPARPTARARARSHSSAR